MWVRRETLIPGMCTKLNYRWDGPLPVTQVPHDGGAYVLEDPFSGRQVKRAKEKIKKCYKEDPWVLQHQKIAFPDEEEHLAINLPPQVRRPPRRYNEEG